ncbi:response regulator [Verrucomicrobiota bacterium sgz303538]
MPLPPVATLPHEPTELDIKSILLVDDDTEFADALRALLESRNFVVTVVDSGIAALREVMSLDFDVIICDLMSPRAPAEMFYLAVKKTKPELTNRFLFITGHPEHPKMAQFLMQTGADVLLKPVETEDVIRTISLVLNRASKAALAA